jgi:molybdenum cofactor cytidylyltransferase
MEKLHGVILAGGQGGGLGFPKALMPIGSSFFLLTVYELLSGCGAKPVHIIITPGLQTTLRPQMDKFADAAFHANNDPVKGQIHSLALGIHAAKEAGATAVIAALVDQPQVHPATVHALIAAQAEKQDKIIAPTYRGKRGHPIIIPAALFGEFTDTNDTTKNDEVMDRLGDQIHLLELSDPAVASTVESPADLVKVSAESDEDDMD